MKLNFLSKRTDPNNITQITNNSKLKDLKVHQVILPERRYTKGLFILVLMLVTGTGTAADQQQIVPEQFQGEWNDDLENCGSRNRSEGRLFIISDRIEFYESAGSVQKIVTHGEYDLELTIELSGEGETWLDDRYFRLSEDLKSLTDITNGNPGFVRYRCP
ncbi:MAG: hypothetical protein SWJ54_16490 [Cyanobacteriota bacterium]|nr:hypothetical protein [Cyanobacteriota bacterium]